MTQQSTLKNPFIGLRPYQSSDSLYYFGRNEQTKTLLRLLHQHRFVAVVGSSGAGKSSLIRAGLVPQLESGFLVQERDQWLVATTKPGDAPLQNLVSSLLELIEVGDDQVLLSKRAEQLTADIEENGTQALLDALGSQLAGSDCNLFILVDQFEELFRFGLEEGQNAKRQQAEQYVALLLSLSRQNLPIYVCLTMRSDFLGDCDAFYGLPEAINKSQFLVPRLTRNQRQEVISNPVNLAGAKIAPRLVDKLLNESIDTRDDLPVLQHALMRTWDVWQESGGDGSLDIEHYEKAHTIHEALDRHADEVFEELDNELNDEQKHIAKILFQALTTIDASNRRIRRTVHLNEVAAIADVSPHAVMVVIQSFCKNNRSFLVLSSQMIHNNPLVDISHESLIRQWKRLDEWIELEKQSVKTYVRLSESSNLYDQDKSGLYVGTELAEGMNWYWQFPNELALTTWIGRQPLKLPSPVAFLKKSLDSATVKKEEKKKELERRVKLLSNSSSKIRRKQTIVTIGITLITLALLGASFLYLSDRSTKQDLLLKYKNTAKELLFNIPMFSDEAIFNPDDVKSLFSVLKKLQLSDAAEDNGTANEFFAYLENTESNKLRWISKYPIENLVATQDQVPLESLTIRFPLKGEANHPSLDLIEIPDSKLEFFVYSQLIRIDGEELTRLVIAESSVKYRNVWKNMNLTIGLLFISTLIIILISHLVSARLVRSPIKDFEDEIQSIIDQSQSPY